MTEAFLLTLVLTLLPGTRPEAGVEIARHALVKAGCADVRVVVGPGPVKRTHEIRARCAALGEPPPGTPEAGARETVP